MCSTINKVDTVCSKLEEVTLSMRLITIEVTIEKLISIVTLKLIDVELGTRSYI